MENETGNRKSLTRRDYVRYAGGLGAGGLLAGCASRSDSDARTDTPGETIETGEGRATETETPTAYEACIEPAGCVTFEEVPERYLVYNGGWADMAFALGQRDGFLTAGNPIPGFLFEPFGIDVPSADDLPTIANWEGGGWNKEAFYELDPDVVLMDPNYMHGTGWDDNWDEDDTEEVRENVAPFFGNNCRRRREFHDYELYSLYGAFDRLADLFRERERYEAFTTVHTGLRETVRSRLPPEDERPTIGLINGGSNPAKGTFYPLDTRSEGYEMKPYRDLDVASTFPESMEGGSIDYEKLLEVDPEMLLVHWGIGTSGQSDSFSAATFREQYVAPMEDHPVGSQLTAVETGNVYPGPYGEQGPLVNLLQTEMVAQQLYPEEFGEFEAARFPDVPEEKQLFDRQRVREVIAGDV